MLQVLGAQQNLETDYRTTGQYVVAAFDAQRQVLQTSSAVIANGREELVYGVVVSSDGYLLTKLSEVADVADLTVTVDRMKFTGVKVVAKDNKWDLALLKVEASGLVPVVYAESSAIEQGSWLVGNGATTRSMRRALPCILSAKPREIPTGGTGAMGGVAMGIGLKEGTKELVVGQIAETSGAKAAGMQVGDVIEAIDGKGVKTVEDMAKSFEGKSSGDCVKVKVKRGAETKELDVVLHARTEMMDPKENRNDQMSGDFSKRRTGFPRVIQTTLLANSSTVGGPLIDMNGKCVGMVIARANRAETFAIPSEELKELAEKLIKSVK